MGNMGYCRFRNTLEDLRDCDEHMHEVAEGATEEEAARKKLIRLCARIGEDYENTYED